MHKKCRKIITFGAIALLGLAVIYLVYVSVSIYRFSRVDQTTRADVAIVLGAGVFGDEPSPVFRERINHGIWLYENSYVDKIIFTGGFSAGSEISDAYVALRFAVANGVPREAIFIEENSTITQENIYYALQIMEENGLLSAILVSDPLHMRRAMLMARDYGVVAYSSPTPTSMYRTWRTRLPFWAREVFFYVGYGVTRIFN